VEIMSLLPFATIILATLTLSLDRPPPDRRTLTFVQPPFCAGSATRCKVALSLVLDEITKRIDELPADRVKSSSRQADPARFFMNLQTLLRAAPDADYSIEKPRSDELVQIIL